MTPKLVVGLQVYNEADRFLEEWVREVSSYADALVVVDDCSTDWTIPILLDGFRDRPIHVMRAPENLFRKNELVLRKWLWDLLNLQCKRFSEDGSVSWMLLLDADEFMEEKFKRDLKDLLSDPEQWYYNLRFHHFWRSRTHYRVDKLWKPSYGPRLVRYDPNHVAKWRETPLHCGSLPVSLWKNRKGKIVDYVIKHYGYVLSPEEKYERYSTLDPEGKYAPKSHYDSILDKEVVLEEWKERV